MTAVPWAVKTPPPQPGRNAFPMHSEGYALRPFAAPSCGRDEDETVLGALRPAGEVAVALDVVDARRFRHPLQVVRLVHADARVDDIVAVDVANVQHPGREAHVQGFLHAVRLALDDALVGLQPVARALQVR